MNQQAKNTSENQHPACESCRLLSLTREAAPYIKKACGMLLEQERNAALESFVELLDLYLGGDSTECNIKKYSLGGVCVAARDTTIGGRKNDSTRLIVKGAMGLAAQHYQQDLNVKWVAEQLFVSQSHLMHEFKAVTGTTFNKWLTAYRIDKAKQLLRSSNMQINEVAAAVGITGAGYFGQVFRNSVGVTPLQYRNDCNNL